MAVGTVFTMPPAGRTGGGFIWEDRPSLYHHANRDSSTEPSAPQPDKAPRQSSTAARPHSLQWMGQSRDSTWPTALTILPSSHRPCCHTTPGKSVLISPKTWAISQSAHYWIMHRFFLKKRYCIIDHNSHPVWMKIIELTDQPKQFKWVSLLTFFRSRIYLTTLYGKMILELCFYV